MKTETAEITIAGITFKITIVVPEEQPHAEKQTDWDKQDMLDDYD